MMKLLVATAVVAGSLFLAGCSQSSSPAEDLFGDGSGKSKREIQEWCTDVGLTAVNQGTDLVKQIADGASFSRSEGFTQAKNVSGLLSLSEAIAPKEIRPELSELQGVFNGIRDYYDNGNTGGVDFDVETFKNPAQKIVDYCEAAANQ